MKNSLYIICFLLPLFFSCSKNPASAPAIAWNGAINPYAPVAVSRTSAKKVFVHFMPWFETNITSGNSAWGQHWTMTNQTPPAHIASWYYPLNTGPYGTSDTNVIDYQLLLMKLSGINGIFIDWPGTLNYSDFPKNVQNAN